MVCPFHKKKMSEVCHKCPLWMSVRGKDPNTGEEIDKWGCSFAWMPFMLMENAKQIRSTAAATESFRNEMMGVGQTIVRAAALKGLTRS